ncbi:MAG: glycosyltransferase family 2 protein, partial [Actinobacteria bacterium]|nr:glycosyltransferase family 2 protein [Actinomycetota bacterium]
METEKKLSIIIPSYYRYEPLKKVLELLCRQTYKPFEVIIADQTPKAERPVGFYEQFKELPLKILDLENPSYSNARNSGALASSGDVLLFIDDDVEFADDFLQMHIETMVEENVDVVVGATSETPTLPDTYNRDITHMDPISLFLKAPHCKWNGMALYIGGLNTSIKRDVFLKVSGFDENIPRMEDIELGYRLFKSGAKILHSYRPFAYHKRFKTGGTRRSQKNIPQAKLISKFYFYKKHFPGWGLQQFFIREILNAFSFRAPISGIFSLRNLKNPFLP